jgi:hypothetical protein
MLTPEEQGLALRYCLLRGIAPSVFRGRWGAEDRQAALDFQRTEEAKCPGCGQPRAESMLDLDDAPAYVAELRTCHACAAVAMEEKAFADANGDTQGVYPFVGRKAG